MNKPVVNVTKYMSNRVLKPYEPVEGPTVYTTVDESTTTTNNGIMVNVRKIKRINEPLKPEESELVYKTVDLEPKRFSRSKK